MDADKERSARIIQRAWRSFIDRQVYAYYRDLINFRARGDPLTILRYISPKESQLVDSASGLYIKFRLIGDKFPPNMAYKIFTKRPICDVGAFAPRDYTRTKREVAKAHNCRLDPKDYKNLKYDDGNWYKRFENNGWRLISNRVLFGVVETAPEEEAKKEQKKAKEPLFKSFHYDKVQREQQKMGRIRRRKIQWVKKAVANKADGVPVNPPTQVTSRIDDQGPKSVFRPPTVSHMTKSATTRNTATPLINVLDEDASDTYLDDDDPSLSMPSDDDAEISDLVLWTSHLDFEHYVTDWSTLGTTHIPASSIKKFTQQ